MTTNPPYTPAQHFAQGKALQAVAAKCYRRAAWSTVVPMIDYEDIDIALESERVILSLGAAWCQQCAELLPELERVAVEPSFASRVLVLRHNLDSTTPPGRALDRFPAPDGTPPPSDLGTYEHRIPVTIYFEGGVEVRRAYGVIENIESVLFDAAEAEVDDS